MAPFTEASCGAGIAREVKPYTRGLWGSSRAAPCTEASCGVGIARSCKRSMGEAFGVQVGLNPRGIGHGHERSAGEAFGV